MGVPGVREMPMTRSTSPAQASARTAIANLALRIAATAGVIACASAASAVVVVNGDEMSAPANGYVGNWNGSSGVAISPHWLITAKHVGGSVNGNFALKGLLYRAVQIVQHPTMDLQLVRVAEELPGFHELADPLTIEAETPCVLGGWGVIAGTPLADGWTWSGTRRETWGANVIDSPGPLLAIQFDNPAGTRAVPHEALFGVNDSGGGMFVYGPGGELELAGVAVSVTGWGSSRFGNAAFAINVAEMHNWIMPYVDPSKPLASSVEAPHASLTNPVVMIVTMSTLASGIIARKRRR